MKKLIILIVSLLLLTSCSENKYNKANEYYNDQDYSSALELFIQLGDYEDSESKAAICEKEIGMRENADYEFLHVLEQIVINRLNTIDEDKDMESLIEDELFLLEEFNDRSFYDSNIDRLRINYTLGLKKQKESFDEELMWQMQILYQEGLITRIIALKQFFEKYDFMSGNPQFKKIYINSLEDEEKYLSALKDIVKDINAQQGEIYNYWSGFTWYLEFENNTDYRFDITYEIEHLNSNGVVVEKEYASAENIKANENYYVIVPFSVGYSGNYPSFYCRNFYIENII